MVETRHFFVVGLPRSRTTWTSVWLSSGLSFCLHDSLYKVDAVRDLKKMLDLPYRHVGLADTALAMFADDLLVEFTSAPVLVIERDMKEVIESLVSIGLPVNTLPMIREGMEQLIDAGAMSVECRQLSDEKTARKVHEYLLPGERFDSIRWRELCRAIVEPNVKLMTEEVMANAERLVAGLFKDKLSEMRRAA